ncbi:MAG: metallophosphoesterase [Luteolibacter sp.]
MIPHFTWLHLSDLHVKASSRWESDRVTNSLVRELRDYHKNEGLYPDAIFFTGDAAFGSVEGEKIEQQYEAFANFLDAIRQAFTPEIDKSRIFLVPGNHDVDRTSVARSSTEWLRNPLRNEEEIISELQKNSIDCKQWMLRLGAYRNFLTAYGLHHLNPNDPHLFWTHKIDLGTHSVGITGLNSAWSCVSKEEKGKLWMGGRWQIGTACNQLGDTNLSVALVHHPSNWLNEIEDPHVGRELGNRYDLILHGHEHLEFVNQQADGTAFLSAGACYDTSKLPKGYSIGHVKVDGSEGNLRLRTWDEGGGGWVAKNIAKKAPSGIYNFETLSNFRSQSDQSAALPSVEQHESLISLTGAPSETILKERLSHLRRRPFSFEIPHSRIRSASRSTLEEILSQRRIAWIVADWQMGKDGFISSVLNNLGSSQALENVYRIDCGKLQDANQIFDDAGAQLGLGFVEFAQVVNHLDQATLILEDFPISLLRETTSRSTLLFKLNSVITFSPNLRIIVTLRQWMSDILERDVIHLESLDIDDIHRYLSAHPKGKDLAKRTDRLDDIASCTEGLTASIDRLIVKSGYLSVDELLDDQPTLESEHTAEAVPTSLKDAVDKIFKPTTEDERRTLALLKLLTVLRDGETFESIRRVYHSRPFKSDDIVILADAALIESLAINQASGGLLPKGSFRRNTQESRGRLIRVPLQVRNYASTLISQEERSKIYNAASESLFGGQWYEGKIKLRRSIIVAYRQSSLAGPGNELLVAQFLLQAAIQRGRQDRIEKYALLATGFCQELISQDRFRDAAIAARAVLRNLGKSEHQKHWINCSYAYGRALRMTGMHDDAIQILTELLESDSFDSKEFKALVHLNLAWAFDAKSNKQIAIQHANSAISLCHHESETWFQAAAIIAENELVGASLEAALSHLYTEARNNKKHTAANNIGLSLAKKGHSREKSLKYLNDVIAHAKDLYNQTRAVVDKADLLRKTGQIGDLTEDDQASLCAAYEYSCSQRISSLLDRSHDALWEFCLARNFWAGMFRLFRFSSFVWCLTDRSKHETKYIGILIEAIDDPSHLAGEDVDIEIEYLERRANEKSVEDTQLEITST